MTPLFFMTSLTILLVIFLIREKIADLLNEKLELKFTVESKCITYLLTALFIIVVAMGMLMDTPSNYGQLSGGIENVNTYQEKKPHPMFDINFNIFDF